MSPAYLIDFLITSANYLGLDKDAVQPHIQNTPLPFYMDKVQPSALALNGSQPQ